ncbi:MAG: hypothetical protein MI863_02760 [Desulfobacterales bacterium]|nr:hypothetical protein [Desulfobacterales bacterium]
MKKIKLLFLAGLMLLLLGCPRITNVKPLNDQTKLLSASFVENKQQIVKIAKEGQVSYTGIKYCKYPLLDDKGNPKKDVDGKLLQEDCSVAIDRQATRTAAVFGALEQYTEALVALQTAPEKSEESARAAADAINSIVSMAGYEPISATITGFAAEAWTQYAQYRAAKDLQDAISKTQKVIPTIEELIVKSIEQYESTTSVFNENILDNHMTKNEVWVKYYESLNTRKKDLIVNLTTYNELQEKQKGISELKILIDSQLIKYMNEASLKRNAVIAEEISQCQALQDESDCTKVDPIKIYSDWVTTKGNETSLIYQSIMDLAKMDVELLKSIPEKCRSQNTSDACPPQSPVPVSLLVDRHASWMKEKRFIEDELAVYKDEYVVYSNILKDFRARQKATEGGLKAMKTAVEKWAKAHAELELAAKNNMNISIVDLVLAVRDIYSQFDDIKGGN